MYGGLGVQNVRVTETKWGPVTTVFAQQFHMVWSTVVGGLDSTLSSALCCSKNIPRYGIIIGADVEIKIFYGFVSHQ